MRTAISAAIIEKEKLLVVEKNQTWMMPGGKLNADESDLECLIRKIGEDLSGTKIKNIKYFTEFYGITPHKKDIIKIKVYFADINGNLNSPSNEIKKYDWTGNKYKKNLSDITIQVMENLIKEGYIRR